MQKRANPNLPMAAEARAELQRLADELGPAGAAGAVGISIPTLGRALSGFGVAPAVRQLVEARLRERAAGGAA